MSIVYLDNNATTQPDPQVIQAMTQCMHEHWGNPSSAHRFGQLARNQMDLARAALVSLLNCRDREIILTSGATEACHMAIHGFLKTRAPRQMVLTTTTEHSATEEPLTALEKSGQIQLLKLTIGKSGLVDLDELQRVIEDHADDIAFAMIHWANNETGVIQPIKAIGEALQASDIPFISDGTQMIGKAPVDFKNTPIDALALSAHKFHGPKGIGALILRSTRRISPWQYGSQERERRGGTENMPGVIGMGVAAALAEAYLKSDQRDQVRELRDELQHGLMTSFPEAQINGDLEQRLDNTLNIGFPKLESEAILLLLSERGICASAGAACSSGSLEPSRVLLAMGTEETYAHGSIRLSLSRLNQPHDISKALTVFPMVLSKLNRSMIG